MAVFVALEAIIAVSTSGGAALATADGWLSMISQQEFQSCCDQPANEVELPSQALFETQTSCIPEMESNPYCWKLPRSEIVVLSRRRTLFSSASMAALISRKETLGSLVCLTLFALT